MDIFACNESDFYQIPRFKLSFRRFCLPDFPLCHFFVANRVLQIKTKEPKLVQQKVQVKGLVL
jgi:hypothetical protein